MFPALVTPSIQIPLSLNKWMCLIREKVMYKLWMEKINISSYYRTALSLVVSALKEKYSTLRKSIMRTWLGELRECC